MLEPPDLPAERLLACLQREYGLMAGQPEFLPLGADANTAVYRLAGTDGKPYFLKLRSGPFQAVSVRLPKFLHERGLAPVIAPLATRSGRLWGSLGKFKLILYPFVEGQDAYPSGLSEGQWHALGSALRGLHEAALPGSLRRQLRRETYSPRWRRRVKAWLARLDIETWREATARETAAFLKTRRGEMLELVSCTERLAGFLRSQRLKCVPCHSDLHAGNLLIEPSGAIRLVDWDNPILAPRERDLMYLGGGQMGNWRTPEEEIALFFQSYGPVALQAEALKYYRFERIVEDVAAFCEQLLAPGPDGPDRRLGLHYLKSTFLPGHALEIAYRSDELEQFRRRSLA